MVSPGAPAWRGLYPFESRFLDLGGYRLHYLDEGRGEAVLMVHGNPTWSFYFRRLVRALRAGRRCLVPDHVGMGLSDRPDDGSYRYTLASRVADLERLVEAAVPEGKLTLVLHDWGGLIGMAWAARHPGRVARICAFNTACFGLPPGAALPAALSLLRGPLGAAAIRGSGLARAAILSSCTARRRLEPAERQGYLEPAAGWERSRAMHRFVQDIPLGPGDPAWPLLEEVAGALPALRGVPVFLPWGMRDWVFGEAFLEGWLARFPGARARRFEDCGHFLLEDSPEEAVEEIARFVRESP